MMYLQMPSRSFGSILHQASARAVITLKVAYTYIDMCTFIHVHMCAFIYTYMYKYYRYVNIHMITCVHAKNRHTRTSTHATHPPTHTHPHTQTHSHTHTHTHAHKHTNIHDISE